MELVCFLSRLGILDSRVNQAGSRVIYTMMVAANEAGDEGEVGVLSLWKLVHPLEDDERDVRWDRISSRRIEVDAS